MAQGHSRLAGRGLGPGLGAQGTGLGGRRSWLGSPELGASGSELGAQLGARRSVVGLGFGWGSTCGSELNSSLKLGLIFWMAGFWITQVRRRTVEFSKKLEKDTSDPRNVRLGPDPVFPVSELLFELPIQEITRRAFPE